jgi:hypothetical protein
MGDVIHSGPDGFEITFSRLPVVSEATMSKVVALVSDDPVEFIELGLLLDVEGTVPSPWSNPNLTRVLKLGALGLRHPSMTPRLAWLNTTNVAHALLLKQTIWSKNKREQNNVEDPELFGYQGITPIIVDEVFEDFEKSLRPENFGDLHELTKEHNKHLLDPVDILVDDISARLRVLPGLPYQFGRLAIAMVDAACTIQNNTDYDTRIANETDDNLEGFTF